MQNVLQRERERERAYVRKAAVSNISACNVRIRTDAGKFRKPKIQTPDICIVPRKRCFNISWEELTPQKVNIRLLLRINTIYFA
jgi:hypothetical protein